MMAQHSLIGASSAHRWTACPGSVGLQRELEAAGIDLSSSSPAAEEGTAAHAILAECLEKDKDAWELADRAPNGEMLGHVQGALDAFRELAGAPGDHWGRWVFVEQGLTFPGREDAFGTVDFGLYRPRDGSLYVVDFKYGKWLVDPRDNPQLLYYAVCLGDYLARAHNISPASVHLGIYQPRRQGSAIVWAPPLSVDGLYRAQETLAHAMEETDKPDAPLAPGDHCRFCPVKNQCPAQAALLRDNFANAKAPHLLSDEELGRTLEEAGHLKTYFDALEAMAYKRLQDGRNVPGWKLVKGRAHRRWNEGAEQKAVDTFGEKAYKKALLTPAALEKLPGGKRFVAENAYMPETAAVLAPANDDRAQVAGDAAAVFAQYLNPKE